MESSKPEDTKIVEQPTADAGSSKDSGAGEKKKDSKAEREKAKAERLAARQQKTQQDQ